MRRRKGWRYEKTTSQHLASRQFAHMSRVHASKVNQYEKVVEWIDAENALLFSLSQRHLCYYDPGLSWRLLFDIFGWIKRYPTAVPAPLNRKHRERSVQSDVSQTTPNSLRMTWGSHAFRSHSAGFARRPP